MATLKVEGVPDALVARLARAAAGNGRSLNSEVIVQLVRAAGGHAKDRCRSGCECRCQGTHRRTVPVGWGGPPAALNQV